MTAAKKILVLFFLVAAMLSSCKKDSDLISVHTISGQVFNLCTDSGMANINVYLQENGNTIDQKISDSNGNFTFTNVQIHSGSNYTYNLYISSTSGIGGIGVGFEGGNWELDKNKIISPLSLGVIPSFKVWSLFFPNGTHILTTDTYMLYVTQNIYHANMPQGIYKLTIGNTPSYPPPTSNFIGNLNNYTMGWWYSTLDKTKNGIHIIKTDSFYVGYGATVTDTIPW